MQPQKRAVPPRGWERQAEIPPGPPKHRKKTQDAVSAWTYVGNEVLKALKGEPERTISSSQLIAIVVVAINPEAFAAAVNNNKAQELARLFTEFYAHKPDLTVELMQVIRRRWNAKSIAARIQKLHSTKAWHTPPIWNDDKCVRPGVLMKDVKDSVLQSELTGETEGEKMQNAEAAKKGRKRMKEPPAPLLISAELHSALAELRRCGFDVGAGT